MKWSFNNVTQVVELNACTNNMCNENALIITI